MNERSVTKLLDRPGLRWPAAFAASVAESAVARRRVVVRPAPPVGYVHRHRDGVLVLAEVLSRTTPARLEHDTLDVFCHAFTPAPGDTVLDIGAGCGEETLTFSRLVGPTGRVISVEAHPVTFRRLELTCAYNGLTNVTPVQLAIADKEARVAIDDGADRAGGSLAATMGRAGAITVRAVTVDRLFADLGLDRVDLLKMNIEGAERLAIEGMAESRDRIANVAISCHDFVLEPGFGGGDPAWFATYDVVTAHLRGTGFDVAPQRRHDPQRPWMRYYAYGSRRSVPR